MENSTAGKSAREFSSVLTVIEGILWNFSINSLIYCHISNFMNINI